MLVTTGIRGDVGVLLIPQFSTPFANDSTPPTSLVLLTHIAVPSIVKPGIGRVAPPKPTVIPETPYASSITAPRVATGSDVPVVGSPPLKQNPVTASTVVVKVEIGRPSCR